MNPRSSPVRPRPLLVAQDSHTDSYNDVATSKHSSDPLTRPIVNIRFRAVWNELLHPTGSVGAEGDIMRGMEEGRGIRVSMV